MAVLTLAYARPKSFDTFLFASGVVHTLEWDMGELEILDGSIELPSGGLYDAYASADAPTRPGKPTWKGFLLGSAADCKTAYDALVVLLPKKKVLTLEEQDGSTLTTNARIIKFKADLKEAEFDFGRQDLSVTFQIYGDYTEIP